MSSYRNVCLEKKGEACVICGSTESVVAHHVDGDRSNNDLDNLEPMCRSCHKSVHAGSIGFEEWSSKLPDSALVTAVNEEAVTERRHATFYLRDDLRTELRRVRKQLELDFDMAYDYELEKNRHFRPLLLYLGAQQVKEMDATEIKNILGSTGVLDATGISGGTDKTSTSRDGKDE